MSTVLTPTQTIDPREIIIAVPCHTGRVDVLTANGICNVIGTGRCANQPLWNYGGSNVGAVRNMVAHEFLTRTECQWLMTLDDDVGFTVADWDLLWQDNGELAVCAEYLQKVDGERRIAHFGLGFARIHREVFERLTQLTLPDTGIPYLRQGYYAGRLLWEFFPQGVNAAGEYRQEDHGFWQLVRLLDVPVRVERRCRLGHSGRSTWRYSDEDMARADAHDAAL